VVHNLFTIINPSRAYFGKKNYQQMLIIQKMVKNLDLPIQIIPCETKRENDGLAMSSRNKSLNERKHTIAGKIPEILMESLKMLKLEPTSTVMKWVKRQFEKEQELRLQYFEILNQENLSPVEKAEPGKTRVFIAIFAENTRLIDNMLFTG
jgi:pantoate--beta-alanine ligase